MSKDKYKPKAKPMPYFEPEGMEKDYKAERMPYIEPEGMEDENKYKPKAKPMPYFEPEEFEGYVSEAERRMMKNNMPEMKKGGMIVARGSRLVKVKPTKLY